MIRHTFIHRGVPDDVLDDLGRVFQPHAPKPLTRDDTREIADNLHGFFSVLERWARNEAAQGRGPWAGLDCDDLPFVDVR